MDDERLDDELDEEGRNPTQQRLDEEGPGEEPVDSPWGTSDDIPDAEG